MALSKHTPQEETLDSLYLDILNDKVTELPSPTKDILMPVPGDGKCGWWTLALNFNILLTCGYLDHFIATNSVHYQKLLTCVNTIQAKLAEHKGEQPPKEINSISELKSTLIALNGIEDNRHGASLTSHQKFMVPALKLFLYTKAEYYEASIEKTRLWGSSDSLAADPDNHAVDFLSEKFAIARILREEDQTEAGIHEWVAIEDMYLLFDLGLQAHVSRHPSIPEQTFQSAYDYINQNLQSDSQEHKHRGNSPVHELKNLREEYENRVLKADGQILDSDSVLMKAVLTGNSFSNMPTYGGAHSSLNSESDMHFWAQMPFLIYEKAKNIGLALPAYKPYFAVHIGNAHKHIQKTLALPTTEDKKPSKLATAWYTLSGWLPCIFLFAMVNASLIALQLPHIAFALTSITVVILTLQNIFSFSNSNDCSLKASSYPTHSYPLAAAKINKEVDKDLSSSHKPCEDENEQLQTLSASPKK